MIIPNQKGDPREGMLLTNKELILLGPIERRNLLEDCSIVKYPVYRNMGLYYSFGQRFTSYPDSPWGYLEPFKDKIISKLNKIGFQVQKKRISLDLVNPDNRKLKQEGIHLYLRYDHQDKYENGWKVLSNKGLEEMESNHSGEIESLLKDILSEEFNISNIFVVDGPYGRGQIHVLITPNNK